MKDYDFQYVVERQKPNPICFGSGQSRNTNPIGKGLSGYQKRYAYEIFTNITPQTYNVETSGVAMLQNKVQSNKGVGGLANGTPRFPHKPRTQIPSPTRYVTYRRRKKRIVTKIPFGSNVPRKFTVVPDIPGVGSYDISTKRCRRTKFQYNFGRPTMVPAVEVRCSPVPADRCERCDMVCQNDYWHKNYTSYLCNTCVEQEKILREDYKLKELKQFQKIRTCTYKHSHEGANHAIQLLPIHKLNKKERLENYLDLYIESF